MNLQAVGDKLEACRTGTGKMPVLPSARFNPSTLQPFNPSACPKDDDGSLEEWLATLPRKVRFCLGMAVSALSLENGQCRTLDEIAQFVTAAGCPITWQAIQHIEHRALRKCRRGLRGITKEHFHGWRNL